MLLRRRPKDRPPEPWENKAQVVTVRRSRFEPAMVEVAAVLKDPYGGFVDRRIRCTGSDLDGDLVFLPWPREVAEQGAPSQPRWVQDHRYETAEGAMWAATQQTPPAKASKWVPASTFKERLSSSRFTRRLEPEAADLGPLQTMLVLAVYWLIASPVTIAANWFGWVLLSDTGPSTGLLDAVKGTGLVLVYVYVLAFGLTWAGSVNSWLRRVLSRHNLDVAINGSQARSLPDEVLAHFREGRERHDLAREERRAGRQESFSGKCELASRGVSGRRREPGRHEAPQRPQRPIFGRRLKRQ